MTTLVMFMSAYELDEQGKPHCGALPLRSVRKDEYDTMHLYIRRKYWIQQQRR